MRVALSSGYQALAERLLALEVEMSPAETQGVLCGLICGGGDADAGPRWLDGVLGSAQPGDVLAAQARREWLGHAAKARVAIEEGTLGRDLLLPGDDRPLGERARALHAWSLGFLYGLGLVVHPQGARSPQTREALEDFVEITRMDLDALEDSEENEAALTELAEFVWVAATLVYEDQARKG